MYTTQTNLAPIAMNTGECYAILGLRRTIQIYILNMAMPFRTNASSDQAMIVPRSGCVTFVLTTYVGVCMANQCWYMYEGAGCLKIANLLPSL